MRISATSPVLAVVFALAAVGCGSKSTPAAKAKAAGPAHPVNATEVLSPYLVSAVVTGKAGAALLQLKFELGAHPEVGDTANVDGVIVPSADNIDQISGSIQGDDGLEVVNGGTIAPVEKAVYGTPIHHALKVEAKHEGIFTLTASFTVKEPPKNPPQMSCSSSPTQVQTGGTSTITCSCTSPDNVPVTVSGWNASGGSISGNGNSATLSTSGASSGPHSRSIAGMARERTCA